MSAHKPTRVLGPQFAPYWHRPQFRYIEAVPGAEAGAVTDPEGGDDLGFPKDTPVKDMSPEQRAAYWHNQTKVQQKKFEDAEKVNTAYSKFGTVEELQTAADAAEAARVSALGDNERALEDARDAGRSEGASTHLGSAVKGMLIALTKGADETFEAASTRVDGAIEFADLTKFVGADGTLDAAKVQTFAQSIGSAGGNDPGSQQSWGEQYQRAHEGRIPPAPGATGSVAAAQQAARERLNKKNA